MHVEEAALSASVAGNVALGLGAVGTIAGTAWALRGLKYEQIPQVGLLSAAFFVASLIHVPVPPTNVHLVLNGLVGMVLGPAAFPAVLIALFLQAMLFGYGGFTTLGVNTLTMALPAVVCWAVFVPLVRRGSMKTVFVAGFLAGMCSYLLSALLVAVLLLVASKQYFSVAVISFVSQVPVAVVEGLVTASAVVFLRKIRPEVFQSVAAYAKH